MVVSAGVPGCQLVQLATISSQWRISEGILDITCSRIVNSRSLAVHEDRNWMRAGMTLQQSPQILSTSRKAPLLPTTSRPKTMSVLPLNSLKTMAHAAHIRVENVMPSGRTRSDIDLCTATRVTLPPSGRWAFELDSETTVTDDPSRRLLQSWYASRFFSSR